MSRATLARVLKPLAGIALLSVVVSRLDTAELSRLWAHGDRGQLALGAGLFVLAFGVLQAVRLHLVVRHYTQGWGNTLRLFAVGAFFNNLLPSNVGGDAVRLLYLRNMRPGNWAGPLTLLLLHRLSGIAVLLLAALVHATLEYRRLSELVAARGIDVGITLTPGLLLGVVLGGCALLGVLLVIPALSPVRAKLVELLGRCRAAIAELSAMDLWLLLLFTLLFHGARLLAFYVTVDYLGHTIAPFDLIPVLAVTAVVALLPITVGGLGLLEGSIAVMLGLFGVPLAAGVAAALVNRVVLVLIAIVGGVLYASDRDALRRAAAGAAPDPDPERPQ